MNPCALPISDVSLSCLSCPFASCLPWLVLLLSLLVVWSELHVGVVVSVEQLVVQVELVGVVPPLPPLLLEACSAGPRRRNGTRKAPIPATIRAMAPTLRFVDESILCFPISLFLGVEHGVRGLGI